RKWGICRKAKGDIKYIICNGDEGDPGAYMDRSVLEGDPHSVLEGMIIGAYAIGAHEGYIYVRAEYPLAVKNLGIAIKQAEEYGLLGQNIFDSGFDFTIKVDRGAGAFVCGEETALIAALEGRVGEPRLRPPYPAQSGLWGKPTNINNVETWANVPVIMARGADWYSQYGTETSKGTKVFSLVGKIENTGLVEVPMGITLREIVYDVGGGILDGKRFKAVQTGGPSGGCIPMQFLDLPVDYERLAEVGAIMGSGGMIVMDEDTCMVDIAKYFVSFLRSESCGKCTSCREGIKRMHEILTDITEGRGREGDIELLEELAEVIRDTSLCALGGTAPNPVLTTIRYFRDEYDAHIKKKRCPAGVCKALVIALCRNTCPAGIDVPRYVRAIADGRFGEAAAIIREKIPFPSVCGRVCFHPCETKCRLGETIEPLAINALKRFVAEQDGRWRGQIRRVAKVTGKRVAIIGSGPAGLTAAFYLAKLGHGVTVFEALPEPGGMMRFGIPDYRLPKAVLDREIDLIEGVGVEIRTNTRVDSLDEIMKDGYEAVFVAIGAHQGTKMGVEGEDSPGVIECVSFLRDVNLGKKIELGDRVAVIGGGNAAIDTSRVALRLGAREVTVVYRRTRREMPASQEEVEEALHEGVKIDFLAAPSKIARENGVLKMECIRMRLGAVDASGRRRPEPIAGSEFTMDVDTVIAAVGQIPEIPAQLGLPITKGGTLEIDPETLATSKVGVFAGGDAVTGPASVIEAIAAGRQVATSIDQYLGGTGAIEERLVPPEEVVALPEVEIAEEKHRPPMPSLPIAERLRGFAEVELGFTKAMAIEEAKRCLMCDLEE
ncbi:MAG: hydrogenase, partial [Dehalococcoidia bacterium]